MSESLSQNIRNTFDDVRGFAHFELGIPDDVWEVLEGLEISSTGAYDNFGDPQSLENGVTRFLTNMGNSDAAAKVVASEIFRINVEVQEAFGVGASWLTLRSSEPSSSFDIPRWHKDGKFYDGDEKQRKVAATLIGDGHTLMADISLEQHQDINALYSTGQDYESVLRREFKQQVKPSQISQAEDKQGSVFLVGEEEASLHSEPPARSKRLFLSIVPGTKEQIKDLDIRWNKKPSSNEGKPTPPR